MRALLLLLILALPVHAADRTKPNIVFILADDLGTFELGCYGQKIIKTPSIDKLATEGMRFTQAYSGSPVCAPSRCCLMTGLHAGHTPVRDNKENPTKYGQFPLPAGTVTLPKQLKDRGYATFAAGKWGMGLAEDHGNPQLHGFDHFFGYYCQAHAHNHYPVNVWRNGQKIMLEGNTGGDTGKQYTQDLFEAEALDWIRKHKEEPFFVYLPFTVPHLALQVPEDALKEYEGKFEDPPYDGKKGYRAHPKPRAAYAAMVTRMDRSVGRVMDLLKELKLDDNTLVVFTSDNGPTYDRLGGSDSAFFHSADNLRGLKGNIYEGGIRVPFIAKFPGVVKPGTTSDLPIAFCDMLPTLCTVAGATVPENRDGMSILPTLKGEKQSKERVLYWELSTYGGQQALRFGDYKLVRANLNKGQKEWELYDLATDPAEKTDLAKTKPDVLAKLAALAEKAHVPNKDFPLPLLERPIGKKK